MNISQKAAVFAKLILARGKSESASGKTLQGNFLPWDARAGEQSSRRGFEQANIRAGEGSSRRGFEQARVRAGEGSSRRGFEQANIRVIEDSYGNQ